jgi:hypothetical protein
MEERQGGDTHPMETDIPKTSTDGVETDLSSHNRLGIWGPFQSSKVLNLRSFTYENKTGRTVQEKVNKVLVTEGALISIVTHVPVMRDVREDHVSIATIGSMFMNSNVENIQRLCQQNKEKDVRIKELEEKLH